MRIIKEGNLKKIINIILDIILAISCLSALCFSIYFIRTSFFMNITALNAQPISGKNISRIIPGSDKINYKIINNYDDYIKFVNLIINNENSLAEFSYRQVPMQYTVDTYIDSIGDAKFFSKKSLVAIDFFEENSDIFFNDIVVWSLTEKENTATIKVYKRNDKSYISENNVEQIVFVAISKNIDEISVEYIEDINEINNLEKNKKNTYEFLILLVFIISVLMERKNKLMVKKSYFINFICTLLCFLLIFLLMKFMIDCF